VSEDARDEYSSALVAFIDAQQRLLSLQTPHARDDAKDAATAELKLLAKALDGHAPATPSDKLFVARAPLDRGQPATDLVAADGQWAVEAGGRYVAAEVAILDVLGQWILDHLDLGAPGALH
jgi:hypothetical protein